MSVGPVGICKFCGGELSVGEWIPLWWFFFFLMLFYLGWAKERKDI